MSKHIDDIELHLLEASGDIELACGAGDFIREALADGVIDEADLADLVVVYERVVIQHGDDAA